MLALCAALPVFGARQLSQNQAWHSFGFDVCQLPCFAGITPGRSGFGSSSSTLVREVPAIDPRMIATGSSLSFWARLPEQQLSGVVRYELGGGVGEIRLNVTLPLEQVITQLGTPDCLLANTTDAPGVPTRIFWERGIVSIAAVLGTDQDAIHPNASVFALWVRAVTPPDCSLRGALPWRGFAPLWAYSEAAKPA
ncbi:MAG: hypothetical protein ABI835_00675 [Chloroflexota bacterium]